MTDAVLQCPKCGVAMVGFHRAGVSLRECGACRGVFLGRGELDRLLGRGASGAAGTNAHAMPAPYEGRHRRD
jgi:Zn-finger nucleic acid-binding protein